MFNSVGSIVSRAARLDLGGSIEIAFDTMNGLGANPVLGMDGRTPLGPRYWGQLYVGLRPNEMQAIGQPRPFRDGAAAGFIVAGNVDATGIPGVHGGVEGFYQLRVWRSSDGDSYEEALRHGGPVGMSAAVDITFTGRPAPGGAGPRALLGAALTANQHPQFALSDVRWPQVLRPPVALRVNKGDHAEMAVMAMGSPPLSYQWRRDGVYIAGATNAILSLPDVGRLQAGDYSVIVQNDLGAAESRAARLRVVSPLLLQSRLLGNRLEMVFRDADGDPLPVVAGHDYQLQQTDRLIGGEWSSLAAEFARNNGSLSIQAEVSTNVLRRFFRIIEP